MKDKYDYTSVVKVTIIRKINFDQDAVESIYFDKNFSEYEQGVSKNFFEGGLNIGFSFWQKQVPVKIKLSLLTWLYIELQFDVSLQPRRYTPSTQNLPRFFYEFLTGLSSTSCLACWHLYSAQVHLYL